jgi:hypothetical protein
MDELRIYDRALSDTDIWQSYISNLNKIDNDTWEYMSVYTGMADGVYHYTGTATNVV